MGALHSQFRWVPWLVSILGMFFLAAPASAQVSSLGLPGLTSLQGFSRGYSAGCFDKPFPAVGAPVFYVGWMNDRGGMTYETSGTLDGLDPFILSHRYPLRGMWLGLAETVTLRDRVDATFSAWVLVPSNTRTSELEGPDTGVLLPFEWERTSPNWYFLDGLLAYRFAGGLTGLAGFRYEYLTTHYRKLNPPVSDDSADVKINHYIPLFGVQWRYADSGTTLLFRSVGFPVVFGSFRLTELFALDPFDLKGNYHSGYFMEVFSEYSRRCGSLDVGIFGRWNLLHGRANSNAGFPETGSSTFGLGLQRTSWTFGGSFSLAFNLPL